MTTKPELKHLDESKRPERVPLDGARDRMTIPNMDPAYHYTWQNDDPGQLERFIAAGYEFVTDPVKVGQPTVNKSDRINGMGQALTLVSGPKILYALRQRIEWYEQDEKARQARIDAEEAKAAQPINDGGYGGVEAAKEIPMHRGHKLS